MGRQVSWSEIPDSQLVPEGVYLVALESLPESQSKSNKLMYPAQFTILEPAGFAGLPLYENLTIDPDTWRSAVSVRIMKRMFRAIGVELVDDLDETIAAALGQQLIAQVSITVDSGKGGEQYKGRQRNSITAFYAVGEQEIGGNGAAPAPAKAPARAPAPAPRAATPPARAAAPAARTATAAPLARAAAPATKPAPAKEKTLRCTVCDQDVPKSEFASHVEGHEE